MLDVKIIQGTNDVHSRTVTNKDTGVITTYYNQFGYVDLHEAFPIKFKIPVESPAQAYPVGDYKLAISSFRVGRFDSLEIDPYKIKLVSAQANK